MLCPVPTRRRPRALRSGRGPGIAALLLTLHLAGPAAASEPASAAPPAVPAAPPDDAAAASPAAPPDDADASPPAVPAAPPDDAAAAPPVSAPALAAPPVSPPVLPPVSPPVSPPRVDGPYIGLTLGASGSFARVNDFETPNPLMGSAASLRFGEAIFPWMTIGVEIAGTWAYRFADPRQRLLQGAALIDFGFLPIKRVPLSLHVGFGAGGGAVRQTGRSARSGFGGAVFTGSVRYEIFPLAHRKRANRGGGFSLGPELGWLGFTPAARGRPMSNTIYLGLFVGFYFGS
jgi:hypothetical protein